MEKIKEETIKNLVDGKPPKEDRVLEYFELGYSLETHNLLVDGKKQGKIEEEIEYGPNGSISKRTFKDLSNGNIIFFIDEGRIREYMEEKIKQMKEEDSRESGKEKIN